MISSTKVIRDLLSPIPLRDKEFTQLLTDISDINAEVGWQEICFSYDVQQQGYQFQGVQVFWRRQGAEREVLFSSPLRMLNEEQWMCAWDDICSFCETVRSICNSRSFPPLVRIYNEKNPNWSSLFCILNFNYRAMNWSTAIHPIAQKENAHV